MLASICMSHDVGSGRSCYFVSVSECLLSGMSTANLAHVILLHVLDGMTRPLACTTLLDKMWGVWPCRVTVWNYGCWFKNNAAVTGAATAPLWLLVKYSVSGAVGGLGNGQTKIWCCNLKKLSNQVVHKQAVFPRKVLGGVGASRAGATQLQGTEIACQTAVAR